MNTPDDSAIIVFAREPVPGRVKTRLAASLSSSRDDPDEFAAAFYAVCLDVLFRTLKSLPFPALPFITPDSSPEYFARFAAGPVFTQQGPDLGRRMRNAFTRGFSRYGKLLLIGSDLPQLGPDTLRAAHAILGDHDCVLGPAEDGGYYLIGFSKSGFCDCFHGMAWGASTVLAQTLERLAGKKTAFLERHRDIDTAADLDALVCLESCPPAVKAFLRERGYRQE